MIRGGGCGWFLKRPGKDALEAMAAQNSCCAKILGGGSKKDKDPNIRQVEYRHIEELPGEVQRLIRGLLDPNENTRTSIRAAKRYLWISEVLLAASDKENNGDEGDGKKIEDDDKDLEFLQCAVNHQQNPLAEDVKN